MNDISATIEPLARAGRWPDVLATLIAEFSADSGTLHLMGPDDQLHLAAGAGIPTPVLDAVRLVPIGKGMAGLAAERRRPVDACNIQTDSTGDVRPGARSTGLQGSIAVPMMNGDRVVGVFGIANRTERIFTDDEQARLEAIGRTLALVVP